MKYLSLEKEEIQYLKAVYEKKYEEFKSKNLSLDMSRGKPSSTQLDLSNPMLDILSSSSDFISQDNLDCRNYGQLDGIIEMKKIFAQLLDVDASNVFVGGNSSLNLMFDTITHFMFHGVNNSEAWITQKNIKFLCPSPGYDRHFGILEYFNIEQIIVPMKETGPDMDLIEKLVSEDDTIKGVWCVPKYSNPTGISYSDDTVKRFAKLKPKAKDFRIFWDNAYFVHDLCETGNNILNVFKECQKYENEDLPIIYCSTSKITFPGSGIAAFVASRNNMENLKKIFASKIIGYDKMNQLRHALFLRDKTGVLTHMRKHAQILKPKFEIVLETLNSEFKDSDIINWSTPKGGYFISVNVLNGCAKRVCELCKFAGLKLTSAGATYPLGFDPNDSNIRIAPTYPAEPELKEAMNLFCICVKLAVFEKIISINRT